MNAIRRGLLAVMVMVSSCAYGLELPDTVGEWRCVNEHVVPLIADADSADLGRMVYRDYVREAPKGSLHVILTEGRGTGRLYVPETVNGSRGAMSADSDYKLITVTGRKSILEVHAYMPVALAVCVDDNTVLTIETPSLSESEAVRFAEVILSSWNNTE